MIMKIHAPHPDPLPGKGRGKKKIEIIIVFLLPGGEKVRMRVKAWVEIQVRCFEMSLEEILRFPPHLNPLPPEERKKEENMRR